MFYYLEGKITILEQSLCVIDISGAGYSCMITTKTLSRLEIDKTAKLYTYCHIKEDAFDIYGFYDLSEKRCFVHLLGVSGVGPKAALSILSSQTPESFALSVINEDETALTVAPGIGKRLAQRIILELKDKVSKDSLIPDVSTSQMDSPASPVDIPPGIKQRDAAAALAVLGYSQSEISAALRSIDIATLTTEEIIREVLKN
ncbi:MAG: Holliday junction branch migration protein RuvA [Oscillospiraceae bacterium]|nr:Holliday junction branch migration protein RuvA [Oscillospiraceae bacterium]